MALSRRNILVALGAAVGGGGALVGTGAFTTVSAERSVEVSTAGDASAFLQLTSDSAYVADSGDTLTIDLDGTGDDGDDSGFNDEAVTQLAGIVEITNNAADGSATTVGVDTADAGSATATGSVTVLVDDDDSSTPNAADVTLSVSDSAGNFDGTTTEIPAGESAYLDAEIDTRDESLDGTEADSVTIVANEQDAGQTVTSS